ncbi:MAG: PIG-L family deacetylase [Sphingobacteriales bacterium]|nr:MAG: PIG-L family deacetylase [Sphingobacteriales bacterium]
MIRKFRPDVIICRFPPDSRAGHGQHSASAILAEKAFREAGDKLRYTEQLAAYKAWQPKRLLWNTFRFGSSNTTSEDQFKLAVGNYSPNIGMGYGELAGISRSIHRSQGAGTPSVPGIQKEYFTLVAGDSIKNSLFDGIDITWNRAGKPGIGKQIDRILAAFDFNNPAASLPALLSLRKEIEGVKHNYWRAQKLKELDAAIIHASGFMAEATAKQPEAVAGTVVPYTLRYIVRTDLPVRVKAEAYHTEDSLVNMRNVRKDSLYVSERKYAIPSDQAVTEPYWLKTDLGGAHFSVPHDSLLGLPKTPAGLNVLLTVRIGGQKFDVDVPLSFKKLDPVRGDMVEELRIVPEVAVEPVSSLIISGTDGSVSSMVKLYANKDISDGILTVFANNKEVYKLERLRMKANSDTTIPLKIAASKLASIPQGDFFMEAEVSSNGKRYNRSQKLIRYEHIPTLQYFAPAIAKVVRNDCKVNAKRIGVVEGAGDYTVTFLRLAGLQVDVLKESDLTSAEGLKKYDAIITGIRAVNVEKRMRSWLPVLHQYAALGGTLVMQYNTLQDLSTTEIGPYPFTLANKRVTEEDADVEVLIPSHRILNYPNKISEADFKDWVQERGLYFPVKWDDRYQAVFSMHDKGEEPLNGATLYAPHGKGHYIYTSLAFFRQLPAGNKGAMRLLMNMLSTGR